MNKDIETVEEALKSVEGALQRVLEKNERQRKLDWANNAEIEEHKLKMFLANVPQATFKKTDKDCKAFVNGICFYCETDSYGNCLTAKHKIVRRFLWKKWIGQRKHYFTGHCQPISWVLGKHLEALKFEADQEKWRPMEVE